MRTDKLPKDIQKRLRKLDALEASGVDNWDGYDFAMEEYYAENKFEIELNEFVDEICAIICADCKIEEPAGVGCGYGISNTEPLFDYIYSRVEKLKETEK